MRSQQYTFSFSFSFLWSGGWGGEEVGQARRGGDWEALFFFEFVVTRTYITLHYNEGVHTYTS